MMPHTKLISVIGKQMSQNSINEKTEQNDTPLFAENLRKQY